MQNIYFPKLKNFIFISRTLDCFLRVGGANIFLADTVHKSSQTIIFSCISWWVTQHNFLWLITDNLYYASQWTYILYCLTDLPEIWVRRKISQLHWKSGRRKLTLTPLTSKVLFISQNCLPSTLQKNNQLLLTFFSLKNIIFKNYRWKWRRCATKNKILFYKLNTIRNSYQWKKHLSHNNRLVIRNKFEEIVSKNFDTKII